MAWLGKLFKGEDGAVTEEKVLKALSTVHDPEIHKDLVTLGMVRDIKISGSDVSLTIVLTTPGCPLKAKIESDVRAALVSIPGMGAITLAWDAAPLKGHHGHTHGGVPQKAAIPGVKYLVAIGSGKGGVGKSTVTVNLAIALAGLGLKVGLIDADIYGPSIPAMMGVTDEKPVGHEVDGQTKIAPIQAHGIKLMSMGFLLPNRHDPVVWRGPMLHGVLNQFMRDVDWGELDFLLVDMPPGTGDVALSLTQAVPLTGAAIVLTPQPVAVDIGLKTLKMLQMNQVPILGIVENMSYFVCPHCEKETDVFDRGGGRSTAEAHNVPFLGDIPLDPQIREGGDKGVPVIVSEPRSAQAKAFRSMANKLVEQVHCSAMVQVAGGKTAAGVS